MLDARHIEGFYGRRWADLRYAHRPKNLRAAAILLHRIVHSRKL